MANAITYGFYDLKSVMSERVTTVGVEVVNEAIQKTLTEHNRQLDALMGLFVTETTEFKKVFRTATAARLQPLDELARARPIQQAGKYENAWPIQKAGTAWAATYEAQVKMTVQEANDTVATLTNADTRWMRDHILAALYYNGSGWAFSDAEHGSLTIKGLANGDTDTYGIMTGTDLGTTDSHYLAQAAAMDNSNDPFATIYSELTEHPENGGDTGDVIVFVPTGLKSSIEALSNFYPMVDGNLATGSGVTTLSRSPTIQTPGMLFGYHAEKVFLYEWKSLPANYMIATTTTAEKPLAMREHMESQLRGFSKVAERIDYPFWEAQYVRWAGFGSWNRVGALVYRIGNATYAAAPSGYTSPMP